MVFLFLGRDNSSIKDHSNKTARSVMHTKWLYLYRRTWSIVFPSQLVHRGLETSLGHPGDVFAPHCRMLKFSKPQSEKTPLLALDAGMQTWFFGIDVISDQ